MGGQNNGNTENTAYYTKLNFTDQSPSTTTTGQSLTVTTPTGTNITSLTSTASSNNDTGYTYPLGLINFTFTTDSIQNQVSLIFQTTLTPSQVIARKYNPNTKTYMNIPGASITQSTLNGNAALNLTYTIADGGPLDEDGSVNGVIVDPVGLAEVVPTATSHQQALPAPPNPQTPAQGHRDTATTLPHRS